MTTRRCWAAARVFAAAAGATAGIPVVLADTPWLTAAVLALVAVGLVATSPNMYSRPAGGGRVGSPAVELPTRSGGVGRPPLPGVGRAPTQTAGGGPEGMHAAGTSPAPLPIPGSGPFRPGQPVTSPGALPRPGHPQRAS